MKTMNRRPGMVMAGLATGLLLAAGGARRFEAAGSVVEAMPAFTTREMADGIDLFWRVRSWLDISALPPERRAKVLPFIRDWAAAG